MKLKITAQVHREGEWFVAFCPEFPEGNGQGRTKKESVASLYASIALLQADAQTHDL